MQWPHQGAKNSTRAGLLELKTTVSKLEGMRFRTSEAVARRGRVRVTSDRNDCSCTIVALEKEKRGFKKVRKKKTKSSSSHY